MHLFVAFVKSDRQSFVTLGMNRAVYFHHMPLISVYSTNTRLVKYHNCVVKIIYKFAYT